MKKVIEIIMGFTGILALVAGLYLLITTGWPKPFMGVVGVALVAVFVGWNAKYIWSMIKPHIWKDEDDTPTSPL